MRGARGDWLAATVDGVGDGCTVLRAIRHDDEIVDWVVVDANEVVRARWSWAVGEIVGKRFSELNDVADNRDLAATYEAAVRTGERKMLEFQVTIPGGMGGWKRVIVIPVDVDTLSVVTRDISRERYFEAAAQRERTWLSALADASRASGLVATPSSEARFMRMSAVVLFIAAGAVTVTNSIVSHPGGVDIGALRATAVVTMLVGVLMAFVPWERHPRVLAQAVVLIALALLGVSDHFDHYSHAQAALAVYPVFFIMTVAWSGLTLGRGAATATALMSAPLLALMFAQGDYSGVGVQCAVVVLPAAAMLGEVLSWSAERAAGLVRLEAGRRLRDPLTGLANRTQLSAQLDHALARSRRTGESLALLFVDLDRFKHVNDTLGHAAGDELLVGTAQRLTELVREGDTVARLGGDEFVVLCEPATATDASVIATRIIEALAEPFDCGLGEARVGASVGIVHCDDDAETAESMLQKADIAMYRAKSNGRGTYEIFDSEMQRWVATRAALDAALRAALDNDEFVVHYQPVVDGIEGVVVGFEALTRWARPGYGLVPPAEFIPFAEESGLIVEIGARVLGAACHQAAVWRQRWPDRRIGVAVNVSSRQVAKGTLLDDVDAALSSSGLDPELLTLELTESALIHDAVAARSLLAELRTRGVRIAVDDFGTGYSSLTYLRAFPIDVIKIDRSFVDTIANRRSDAAIVAAVLALARNLDIEVVAEGVESHEQLATLMYLNCRLLQGFLFSPPLPAGEAEALVEQPVLGGGTGVPLDAPARLAG